MKKWMFVVKRLNELKHLLGRSWKILPNGSYIDGNIFAKYICIHTHRFSLADLKDIEKIVDDILEDYTVYIVPWGEHLCAVIEAPEVEFNEDVGVSE